jgi:hypothetical protein
MLLHIPSNILLQVFRIGVSCMYDIPLVLQALSVLCTKPLQMFPNTLHRFQIWNDLRLPLLCAIRDPILLQAHMFLGFSYGHCVLSLKRFCEQKKIIGKHCPRRNEIPTERPWGSACILLVTCDPVNYIILKFGMKVVLFSGHHMMGSVVCFLYLKIK